MGIFDWFFGKNSKANNNWGIPSKEEEKRKDNKKAIAKKIKQDQGLKEQKESKKPKKETTSKLTDDQKHWLGLVEIRVNSLPFDFIKRTYTVDSLGEAHFGEYKVNEPQVPEDKREEVALARVEGLSSIRDYIQVNGSKEQKFHLDSSIIGALLYASSLGINVDKYEI